jgi:hypothetical protein
MEHSRERIKKHGVHLKAKEKDVVNFSRKESGKGCEVNEGDDRESYKIKI